MYIYIYMKKKYMSLESTRAPIASAELKAPVLPLSAASRRRDAATAAVVIWATLHGHAKHESTPTSRVRSFVIEVKHFGDA